MSSKRFDRLLSSVAMVLISGAGIGGLSSEALAACDNNFDGARLAVICEPGQTFDSSNYRYADPSTTGVTYDHSGNDVLVVRGGRVVAGAGEPDAANVDSLRFAAGNDFVNITSGSIGTAGAKVNLYLGDGNDTFVMTGGTIDGSIYGEAGDDDFTVTGGTINGDMTAKTIAISGGTINGRIHASNTGTLTVNGSSGTLNLADRIVIDGSNPTGRSASAVFREADLGAGGKTQRFRYFSQVELDASSLRFNSDQGIARLFLQNGSTVFTSGNVAFLLDDNGGRSQVTLNNSAIDMINGSPTDRITVGSLSITNSELRVDIDQDAGQSDQINVVGATPTVTTAGTNTLVINVVGTPTLNQITEIAVINAPGGVDVSQFVLKPYAGTLSDLFLYDLVNTGDGFAIRATPDAVLPADPATVVSNASTLDNSISALNDITDAAASSALGLAGDAAGSPPPFGIFSTGQLAYTRHDGLRVDGGGRTPSYDSREFSAAVSLDLNAGEYFGLSKEYGLNIGVFGGYASTDVTLGSFGNFSRAGDAFNQSGMAGAYGLLRHDRDYLLISALGIFGETDVKNNILNGATGSYDTTGYAVTASVGHIFSLSDTMRFDLRGGVLAASFTGDRYTDSLGVSHGESDVSFGGVKFEPGFYSEHKLENGMSISPYVRTEFLQLFGYKNTASAGGRNASFDSAEFSAALSAGVNVKITPAATVSAEVKGKTSADSNTIAAKLGLKVAF